MPVSKRRKKTKKRSNETARRRGVVTRQDTRNLNSMFETLAMLEAIEDPKKEEN